MPNHVNNTITVFNEDDKLTLRTLIAHNPSLAEALLPVPPGMMSSQYHWCIDTWGTKWGDYDGAITEDNDLHYSFTTAWSPLGGQLLAEIALKLPNFTYEYSEQGCDFGGIYTVVDGNVARDDEYDYITSLLEQEKYSQIQYEIETQLEWMEIEEMNEEWKEALEVIVSKGFARPE